MTAQDALNLALHHHHAGDLTLAEAMYRRLIAQSPTDAETLFSLGILCSQIDRLTEAAELMERAITLEPSEERFRIGIADVFNEIGTSLLNDGKAPEAADAYQSAIQHRPDSPEAYVNLSNALAAIGQRDEAIAACQRAIMLRPDLAEAHVNLGNLLHDAGRLTESVIKYEEAIRLNPDLAEAHNNLGNTLKDQARIKEAIDSYKTAVTINPHYPAAQSNLLYASHFDPNLSPADSFDAHTRWARQFADPLRDPTGHTNPRDPDKKLRIAYVSPDFRDHPVGRFMLPIFLSHDPKCFEIACYSDVFREDQVTAQLRTHTAEWHNARRWSDEELAKHIRNHQIDILIDLAGHTAGNRLLAFARKPAPVQISYLGYPDTTGMSTMDGRITDAEVDPPGASDKLHTERLIRLDCPMWAFAPPENAPDISAAPHESDGFITFGSFNALPKLNPRVLDTWAAIIRSIPRSRLLIKSDGLNDEQTRSRLLTLMGDIRVDFLDRAPTYRDHLNLYGRIDIALDPFPYNGTTTTCEALWMGVPILTLAGNAHAGRVGVSLLPAIGLSEWIAPTVPDYIRLAVDLSADRDAMMQLRRTLRDRMRQSALCDAKSLARSLEAAYRDAWQRWCAQS